MSAVPVGARGQQTRGWREVTVKIARSAVPRKQTLVPSSLGGLRGDHGAGADRQLPPSANWCCRPSVDGGFRKANVSDAARGAGRRKPSNSPSRTPCSRSGAHRLAPPPAAYSATADIAGDLGGGRRSRPFNHVKPRHDQVERLLILGSTGHCRPLAAGRVDATHRLQCSVMRICA